MAEVGGQSCLPGVPSGGDSLHGGDIWGWSRRLGMEVSEILDLSASLNPLGPPPGLGRALQQALELICHYPDRQCHDLRQGAARALDLEPACILPGNGSTSLIRLLAHALDFKSITVIAPNFSEFGRALAAYGHPFCNLVMTPQDNFAPSRGSLAAIWESSPACLILTNPTSPAGGLIEPAVLQEIFDEARRRDVWLILDEAYMDFAPDQARNWSLPLVRRHRKLVVLRSLTKFYCLAGLRLGLALADPDTLASLAPSGTPWSVNTLAQAAGSFCLTQERFAVKSRSAVDSWRAQQAAALDGLGLKVFPSQANYLLCELPSKGPSAAQVADFCATQGVLLRDCASFAGCSAHHLRVAVSDPAGQDRLIKALAPALAQEPAQAQPL